MALTGGNEALLYALSIVFEYSQLMEPTHHDRREIMTVTRALHVIAGSFILISLALAHYLDPRWLWFTAFVGANLFQSGFTNWCLLSKILQKAGLRESPAS